MKMIRSLTGGFLLLSSLLLIGALGASQAVRSPNLDRSVTELKEGTPPARSTRLELGVLRGGVTLVLEKLGGGAGRRSNGKRRVREISSIWRTNQ